MNQRGQELHLGDRLRIRKGRSEMVRNLARRLGDVATFQSFNDWQVTLQRMEPGLAGTEDLQLRGGGHLDHAGEEDMMKP